MFNLNQVQDFFFKNYLNSEQQSWINKEFEKLFYEEFLKLKENGSDPKNHIFTEAASKAEKRISLELEKQFEDNMEEICVQANLIDSFMGTLVTKFLLYVRDCDFILDVVQNDNEASADLKKKLYKQGVITLEGDIVDESNRL